MWCTCTFLNHFRKANYYAPCFYRINFLVIPSYIEIPWYELAQLEASKGPVPNQAQITFFPIKYIFFGKVLHFFTAVVLTENPEGKNTKISMSIEKNIHENEYVHKILVKLIHKN